MAAKTATELSPDRGSAWLTRGRCEANLGEPELALRSLERAADLDADVSVFAAERAALQALATAREGMENPGRVRVVDTQPPAS